MLVNGVKQSAGYAIDISADQLAYTTFESGGTGGTHFLWVRAFDGTDWGAWAPLTVVSPEVAQPPSGDHAPLASEGDVIATKGEAFQASELVHISDGDGDPIIKVQFWDDHRIPGSADDNPAADISGRFVMNGQPLPEGQALEVRYVQLNSLTFQSGSGTDLLWARAYDGLSWGSWQSFHIIAPIDVAPLLTVSDQDIWKNTNVNAASLFTASDPDQGDTIVSYQFWDSTPGPTSGHFVVDGIAQTANQAIDVSASDLAQATFQAGETNSVDALWVRASDGIAWSDWQEFHVTAQDHAPVVTATDIVTESWTVAASSLFNVADSDAGDIVTAYQFWDDNTQYGTADDTIADSMGYFVVNGAKQSAGHAIDVTPAEFAQTAFTPGAGAHAELLWMRAFDGSHWSPWALSTVTTPPDFGEAGFVPGGDRVPDVSVADTVAAKGQSFAAPQLAQISDPDGDAIVKVQFWDDHNAADVADDNPALDTSGRFILNGQTLPEGQGLEVPFAQLDALTFQSGSGTDLLWVRAFDGLRWSDWQDFHVIAPLDRAPAVDGGDASVLVDQEIKASTLLATKDADAGDTIATYQFWDSTSAATSGHLVVNGVEQPANTEIDVLAAELDQTAFVASTVPATDHLWVRVNDGVLWSDWHPFDIVTHA